MLKKAEEWRKRHGAQFEQWKYMLVHFTRYKQNTDASIEIIGTTIRPAAEAKYLDVIFDEKSKYRAHLDQVTKKGTIIKIYN